MTDGVTSINGFKIYYMHPVVTSGNFITVTGIAIDSNITPAYNNDHATVVEGTSDTSTTIMNSSKAGTISFTLLSSSKNYSDFQKLSPKTGIGATFEVKTFNIHTKVTNVYDECSIKTLNPDMDTSNTNATTPVVINFVRQVILT
jgi:hypothetical protein